MPKSKPSKTVSVFDFQSYKAALKELLRQEGVKGGQTGLATAIGCQPAYLSRVLNNGAHLSLEQAEAVSRHFILNKAESAFFMALVGEERAGTEDLRGYWREQKAQALGSRLELKNRVRLNSLLSNEDKMTYFSAWPYAAVHASVTIPRLQTAEALAAHLSLTPEQVRATLKFLCETGLVEQKGARFTTGSTSMHLDKSSPLVAKHHLNWRLKGMEMLNQPATEDLHYTSVITVARRDLDKVKEALLKAIESVRSVVSESDDVETLACYSLDLFRLDEKECEMRFLILLVLVAFGISAFAGGIEISGGAGNSVEISFRQTAQKALDQLRPLYPLIERELKIQPVKLDEALASVTIETTCEDLLVQGERKTAVNQPRKKKLHLSEPRWENAPEPVRVQLALHELLGLAYGDLDADLKISQRLFQLLGQLSVENAVLAVANAGIWTSRPMAIQHGRTRRLRSYKPRAEEDEGELYRIYIQTFENGSEESVRIYHVGLDQTGAIRMLRLTDSEGPVGP